GLHGARVRRSSGRRIRQPAGGAHRWFRVGHLAGVVARDADTKHLQHLRRPSDRGVVAVPRRAVLRTRARAARAGGAGLMAKVLDAPPPDVIGAVVAEHPSPNRDWKRLAVPLGGFLAAAILPPLLLDGVWNFTLTLALIYGLLGLSIVVVTGYVGQLSLMPATFVGVGAFASAGLVARAATPFWWAAPLAAL